MNIFEEIDILESFMNRQDLCCHSVSMYKKQIEHLEKFKNEKLFYKNHDDIINIPDFNYDEYVVAELLEVNIDHLAYVYLEEIDNKISELNDIMHNYINSDSYKSLKKIESYKNKALLGGTIQNEKEVKKHLYETKRELNSFLLGDSTMRTFFGGVIDSMFSQSQKINFTVDDESFDNSINNLVQNNGISKEEASLYELLYELCILDSSLITESLKNAQFLEIERVNQLENEDEITPIEARNRRTEIVNKYNDLKLRRMNNFNKNFSDSKVNSNQVDAMIDAMVNGTMDINGQTINDINNNTRTMGFTVFMLIELITGICSFGLIIIGVMLTV